MFVRYARPAPADTLSGRRAFAARKICRIPPRRLSSVLGRIISARRFYAKHQHQVADIRLCGTLGRAKPRPDGGFASDFTMNAVRQTDLDKRHTLSSTDQRSEGKPNKHVAIDSRPTQRLYIIPHHPGDAAVAFYSSSQQPR